MVDVHTWPLRAAEISWRCAKSLSRQRAFQFLQFQHKAAFQTLSKILSFCLRPAIVAELVAPNSFYKFPTSVRISGHINGVLGQCKNRLQPDQFAFYSVTATTSKEYAMTDFRKESDSLGVVEVPADKLWGAQTQRSLEHFSIGTDLIPREMITGYAILKKAAAAANHTSGRLDDKRYKLIVQTCDEILAGQHHDMFPLHVWMTGSGTQFNMNVNEVISNRCSQLAGTALGSHTPVHPNDHVNMAQSSNDSFPSTMNSSRGQCQAAAGSSGGGTARCPRRQIEGMGQRRQDRAHPHAGRHAADAGSGVVRLCWDAIG